MSKNPGTALKCIMKSVQLNLDDGLCCPNCRMSCILIYKFPVLQRDERSSAYESIATGQDKVSRSFLSQR